MPGEIEITDEMLIAAMRAFEPMALGLRHKEADPGGWHASDLAAMRAAIEAIAPLIFCAAYERGQIEMRERAARALERRADDEEARCERLRYVKQYKAREAAHVARIARSDAAAIRALPTGGENG